MGSPSVAASEGNEFMHFKDRHEHTEYDPPNYNSKEYDEQRFDQLSHHHLILLLDSVYLPWDWSHVLNVTETWYNTNAFVLAALEKPLVPLFGASPRYQNPC